MFIPSPPCRWHSSPINKISLNIALDAGFNLADIKSPYHQIDVENRDVGKYTISLKNNTTLKKFVFASSSSVYGNQSSIMNEDTSLTKPVSPYGVTKLAAENLVNLYFKNYEIPTISLRYFTVYGPRQRPDMAFSRFFRSIIKDKKLTIFGNGEQTRDFTYVDDIVDATINAATSDSVGEILNVGGGSIFSLIQIIEFMKEITEKELEIDFKKEQKGDVKHTSADISKAEKLINYKSNTDIKYGLTQQYEYIKTNLNFYDD